ncbi:MAG: sugar kinase [Methylocystaceae bacterium]|nr:sugar kinase [Methylocystaceae bacterium]
MNLDNFVIPHIATLREALVRIERNQHGIILATDAHGGVIGLATDGDIRRQMLNGRTLNDPISSCVNSEFVFEDPQSPRELLLKKLDQRIRVIPLLDTNRRLVGLVSRDHMPVQTEEAVFARARSPVRISFGGGGSDLTHFFQGQDGAVINTTISLYSHATLRLRNDEKVHIHSLDLKESLFAESLQHALDKSDRFGLIKAILKTINPNFGFELYLHSDFPMNSGLGGSAVVSAAILGCFNQFRLDQWDSHELAELAYQSERHYLGVSGGWQDQYATVFGGFNFMEFRMDQNIVHPLRIHPDVLLELEESLLLCDTGIAHDSGNIHDDQRQAMSNEAVLQYVSTNVDLSYKIRNQLLRGKLIDFGHSLHETWQLKRKFSKKISNERLDQIYESARNHGALGGKLLGAGGGGFFLFYVTPFKRHNLIEHLEQSNLRVRPFRFEQEGLRAWTVRERKNTVPTED